MLSLLVGIMLIISIVFCIQGIRDCILADALPPVWKYTFIIISIALSMMLIGFYYMGLCLYLK